MTLEDTLLLCSKNYLEFKNIGEKEKNLEMKLRYYKKALFWLENYVAVLTILISENNVFSEEDRKKVENAKKALLNKLSNYLNDLLKDLES